MTEDEAQGWITTHFGADVHDCLANLVAIVREESTRQNLIASSTLAEMWARHIVDSAQLLMLVPPTLIGSWLDIGTGAGFPGLVVAILSERPITLIEPRRKRAAFLSEAVDRLGVAKHVTIVCSAVEAHGTAHSIISARAVAPLAELFALAQHCSHNDTMWVLPKGRRAKEEIAQARLTWHGVFHVEHSVTDPDSLIVVASKVSLR